jgi:Glycosyltransferase
MRVLLCSPYSASVQFVQGGIAIWARNVMEYYQTLKTDITIQVVPFDRTVRADARVKESLLKRIWYGISDYSNIINKTRRQLINSSFDVLHLCTSASISLFKDVLVLRMARRRGIRSVVHFHFGRIPELAERRNWEWRLLRRVIELADAAVVMDLKSYSTLHNQGYRTIHYLPNPLSRSIQKQILKESTITKRESRRVCFVGHVIPSKGVLELVEACKQIDDIRLHVIGKVTADVRTQMEQISGCDSWLCFIGEVDHQQVIREMLSSSIFVLPTYTEGFPNVILESMACGCAIVTTPVGAIPEMLNLDSSEPCGLCSKPKDVEGLRRNIQFYLDHPSEASQYAERAMRRVNEMYAIETVWKQMVGIWEEEEWNT